MHGAVEHVRHAEGLAARHRHAKTSGQCALRRGDRLHGRAGDHHQFDGVSTVERQLDDLLVANDVADARTLDVHERRGPLYGDGLLETADAQAHVHDGRPGHLQHDACLNIGTEPLQRGLESIRTGRQIRQNVRAAGIGDTGAHETRVGCAHWLGTWWNHSSARPT